MYICDTSKTPQKTQCIKFQQLRKYLKEEEQMVFFILQLWHVALRCLPTLPILPANAEVGGRIIFYSRNPRNTKKKKYQLISARWPKTTFSYFIDPLGRPTVMADSDHCFRMCRTSIPTFQSKFQAKTKFIIAETVGLADWIIDDSLTSID